MRSSRCVEHDGFFARPLALPHQPRRLSDPFFPSLKSRSPLPALMQGIDRWHLKVQRVADKNLDKFETYAMQNCFAIPDDLQLTSPTAPNGDEAMGLDAETDALWAQLQQALAMKRALKQKIAHAENAKGLWERHCESVRQLAASQQASSTADALQGAQQLTSTLEQGWQRLRAAEGATAPASMEEDGADAAAAPGPRGLQQRFAQRRMQISTVSVPDLGVLSSLLCAS